MARCAASDFQKAAPGTPNGRAGVGDGEADEPEARARGGEPGVRWADMLKPFERGRGNKALGSVDARSCK